MPLPRGLSLIPGYATAPVDEWEAAEMTEPGLGLACAVQIMWNIARAQAKLRRHKRPQRYTTLLGLRVRLPAGETLFEERRWR